MQQLALGDEGFRGVRGFRGSRGFRGVKGVKVIRVVKVVKSFSQDEVHTTCYSPCPLVVGAIIEQAVVIAMHQVSAHFQFLLKLHLRRLHYVRVAKSLLVSPCIVIHSLLQSRCYAHIVHYQSSSLLWEHSVHPCYCLHQVMSLHRLIHIHRGK